MTPLEKLETATEPYRKSAGWISILGGAAMFASLGFIATTVNTNRTQIENNQSLVREQLTTLQMELLDRPGYRHLPVVTYLVTGNEGTAILINWPSTAQDLLGWTSEDILQHGIVVIMPDRYRGEHSYKMTAALKTAASHSQPKTRNVFAMHKEGHEVPVEITTWITSKENIKTANAIIRKRDTETQLSMEY